MIKLNLVRKVLTVKFLKANKTIILTNNLTKLQRKKVLLIFKYRYLIRVEESLKNYQHKFSKEKTQMGLKQAHYALNLTYKQVQVLWFSLAQAVITQAILKHQL